MDIEQGFERVNNLGILVPTDLEVEQFIARLNIPSLKNLPLKLNLLCRGTLFFELVF